MTRGVVHRFRIYVAGDAENSARALTNLTALCRTYLPGRYRIEIVDVFTDPDRALADRVFMTPTLVRIEPSPVRRIVGTLSDRDKVLDALGLQIVAA
jgi:circadian clock protein KaiB